MKSSSGGFQAIRFGTFELDVCAGELRKQGVRIKLPEQPLRVLELLLKNPGQLVTREELRRNLWPTNTLVDFDHGLNRAINKLREAIGDSVESPRFIETLAKRGYRFLADARADASQVRSLMVLPLDSLSQDPEQAYFAVGLTEALTTTLAKISALRVVSHTTATYYKHVHKPLPEIARELGVDGVIEGSVLRAEGRVRITVQLLHAPTDAHAWAESYDREMRDILALQSEVANAIVKEIKVKLTPQEQTQLERTQVIDAEAYDAYLRGRYYWSKRTIEGSRRAVRSFEQAIACEPRYAAAYAGLADCYGIRGYYAMVPPQEGCAKGKMIALQAIEIDPHASEPHTSLAWALQYYDYDFVAAEREYRRSIELDPRYIVAHYWLSMSLGWQGRFDEAIAEAKYALNLDPLSIAANPFLCMAYLCSRQYEQMAAQARRTLELYPEPPPSHWALAWAALEMSQHDLAIAEFKRAVEYSGGATLFRAMLAEAYAVVGDSEQAQEMLQRLLENAERDYVTPYMIARIHAALGHADEAFHWLETAWKERAAWMPFLKIDPRMDALRSDRRFAELMGRINFPPVPAR
jgi:TolB-like protein/Tfp pilus assembly protein PilF